MVTKSVKKMVNRLLVFAYVGIVATLFELICATFIFLFRINGSFTIIPSYELVFFYGYSLGLLALLYWFVSHREYLERKVKEHQLQKGIRDGGNKIPLKLWITVFFFTGTVALYSCANLVIGGDKPFLERHFIVLTLSFLSCLAVYHLVLKVKFEKMQKQYEEAGSLKKTIKKWKDGDTE